MPNLPSIAARPRLRHLAAATLLATSGAVAGTTATMPATPAAALTLAPSGWTTIFNESAAIVNAVNSARAAAGLPALAVDWPMSVAGQNHSIAMAAAGTLYHTPDLAGAGNVMAPGWTALGENVGYSDNVTDVDNAFMASAEHRANILGPYNLLGVGVVNTTDGRVWVTEEFARAPLP